MASLFGKNKLHDLASGLDADELQEKIEVIKKWQNDYHRGSLKIDKETSREQSYNQDFFISVLGYREKPSEPYSFEPKASTLKGQLPDAVISFTDKPSDIVNISAVVELKAASIDLDRPQRREGNLSPIQQGFKYKTLYRNCPFVIVSNFYELRLYHDNQLDYESWTLDDLVDPSDDYLHFKTFYTLLSYDNFTSQKGSSTTENLLSDIRIEQETISKKFYKKYQAARLGLLRDIYSHNDIVKTKIDIGIEKSQKIIDRIVFACFAEDRGLLPDNIVQRVVAAADNSAFGGSLWSTFKGFFEAIDKGSLKLEIPEGYNGGLFAYDEVLNNLQIGDDALRAVARLGTYNFVEDLSVNILGHIFEQSISDLEEIKNKVSESQNLETLNLSRRKKDGIFYTPDYIVRYIVDSSLGAYLRENEERFKQEAGLHGDINDKNYEKREKQAYSKYQDFVQNIKVLDPACGSGAFLVYVFDYLLAENRRVGDILGNSLFSSEDYVRDILHNNIFGVDLNEESVEITKLSLWLKSAHKGKKLTALDNNIKCGNSLVNDPAVAFNKVFDWNKEFPEVIHKGGFDIVVGNPPYVDSESMVKHDPGVRNFITQNYTCATGNWDLLIPFIELALKLLTESGKMSYITSNKWLSLDYGTSTRKRILPLLNTICDCTMERVFESANVSSVVFGANKDRSKIINIGELNAGQITTARTYEKNNTTEMAVLENNLSLIFSVGFPIVAQLSSMSKIGDSQIFTILSAFTTGEAYEFAEYVEEGKQIPSEDYYRLVNTGTIDRYLPLWGIAGFSYLKSKYKYPVINRATFKKVFPRRFDKFNKPKIIITGIRYFECFLDCQNEYLSTKSTTIITGDLKQLKLLVTILNSKFITFYIRANYLSSSMGGGINFTPDLIRNLPLPKISSDVANELSKWGENMHDLTFRIEQLSNQFQQIIKTEYGLETWPSKLNKWWDLDFDDFISGLRHKMSLDQKDELYKIANKYRPQCFEIDAKIKKIESEINKAVYKIYKLSFDEIKLIEQNSL